MNNKTRQMIKDVIEENAVQFKTSTTSALYEKVGNALSKKYAEMSKNLFEDSEASDAPAEEQVAIPASTTNQPATARPDTSIYAQSLYNPQDPFWRTQTGDMWMFAFRYLANNWNNPDAWGRPGSLPQYATRETYEAWLNSKLPRGTFPPPFRRS